MYGYYLKRNEQDFVINIELSQYGSGYNVVPKSVDPWNAYDIAEVQVYAAAHPEMEVVWSETEGKYIQIEA
jgi:hypothetical protein